MYTYIYMDIFIEALGKWPSCDSNAQYKKDSNQGLIGAKNYNPPEGLDEFRTLNRESFDVNKLFPILEESPPYQRFILSDSTVRRTAEDYLPTHTA